LDRSKRVAPFSPQPRLRRGEQADKNFFPPTPFLFARLLETPSDFFGRRGRKKRIIALAPPFLCARNKLELPFVWTSILKFVIIVINER